jgi:hypothetical protein
VQRRPPVQRQQRRAAPHAPQLAQQPLKAPPGMVQDVTSMSAPTNAEDITPSCTAHGVISNMMVSPGGIPEHACRHGNALTVGITAAVSARHDCSCELWNAALYVPCRTHFAGHQTASVCLPDGLCQSQQAPGTGSITAP